MAICMQRQTKQKVSFLPKKFSYLQQAETTRKIANLHDNSVLSLRFYAKENQKRLHMTIN